MDLAQPGGPFSVGATIAPGGNGLRLTTGEFNGQPGSKLVLVETVTGVSLRVRGPEWAAGGVQTLAVSNTINANAVALNVLGVDLNGDGDQDNVVDTGSNFVFLRSNTQLPNFFGVLDSVPGNTVGSPRLLSGDEDVDGDGDQGLINLSPGVLQVLCNPGNGALVVEPVQLLLPSPIDSSLSNAFVSMAAMDSNGDGRDELVGKLKS